MAQHTSLAAAAKYVDPIILPVPTLALSALVPIVIAAYKKAGCPFSFFNEDVGRWDPVMMPQPAHEQRVMILTHDFGRIWTLEEGRELQMSLQADGHPWALLTWMRYLHPRGKFLMVLNNPSQAWRHPQTRDGYLPGIDHDDTRCSFNMHHAKRNVAADRRLVMFRVLP